MSEKTTRDPVRVAAGGVVVRRELFERLDRAGRVTEVSGPAGSGKSVLLRSWIDEAGVAEHAAQVPVQDEDRDPQRFWTSVAGALRNTAAGSALIRPLPAGTDVDGWAVVERLLADLGSLRDRIWLVVDDVHALDSEALRQLELLVMRAPAGLRFVFATRHDLRLGLHRLRLEGELTEIRAASLRFSPDEAGALFEAAGVRLPESALTLLHERTEGWAAGLRLAALSLTGHPDPERFAAEFCGSERCGRIPVRRGPRTAGRGGAAAAVADFRARAGQRPAGRPADRRVWRGADLAGAGAGRGLRGRGGRAAILVPLSPAVRRSARAGAAADRAG
jgi:LuxR family maltose regulon positive regulatory protein